MKVVLTKISAVLSSIVLMTSFASCGKNSGSGDEKTTHYNIAGGDVDGDVNVSEDEMPYGSTMRSLKPAIDDIPIMIEFDYRFLSDEIARDVSSYMAGVVNKDPSLMQKATNPTIFEAAMASENAGSPEEYAAAMYDDVKEVVGDDFTFSSISIQGVGDSSSYDFSSYDSFVISTLPDAEITDRKLLELDIYYDTADSSGSLYTKTGAYVTAAVYNIDGENYIIG